MLVGLLAGIGYWAVPLALEVRADTIAVLASNGRELPAEEVAALVRRAVPSPETVAIVVVGPAAEIAPKLERFGPIEITEPEKCMEPQ